MMFFVTDLKFELPGVEAWVFHGFKFLCASQMDGGGEWQTHRMGDKSTHRNLLLFDFVMPLSDVLYSVIREC